jgi:hypothetical protein
MATAVAERTETAAAGTNGKAPGMGRGGGSWGGGRRAGCGNQGAQDAGGGVCPDAARTAGKLEEVAAKAGVTPQVWVRDHLAGLWGVCCLR